MMAKKAKTYDRGELRKKMCGYVPLHFHTEFSVLDGVGRHEELIRYCSLAGVETLARDGGERGRERKGAHDGRLESHWG